MEPTPPPAPQKPKLTNDEAQEFRRKKSIEENAEGIKWMNEYYGAPQTVTKELVQTTSGDNV